jgi:hypothetical protein
MLIWHPYAVIFDAKSPDGRWVAKGGSSRCPRDELFEIGTIRTGQALAAV